MENQPKGSINVEQSVRPLRLALLVDPYDLDSIRRAISCNTGQWAGMFNPLIPVFKRRPTWWTPRLPFPDWAPSAIDLANAAIEAWDPDFVVECREQPASQPAENLPRMDREVLMMHHFDDQRQHSPAGVSTRFIIQQLHEELFRFMRAGGPEAVVVGGTGPLADFAAAAFGDFGDGEGRQLASFYRESLGASDIALDASNLLQLLGYASNSIPLLPPLRMGTHKLSVFWPFVARDKVLFLISPSSGIDLIDFWNLRAAGRTVIPVPVELASQLMPQISEAFDEIAGGNDGPITFACGRRIPEEKLKEFRDGLDQPGRTIIDPGLLTWDYEHEGMDFQRPDIAGAEDQQRLDIIRERVEFPLITPKLTRRGTAPNLNAWASVVRFRPYLNSDDRAAAFSPALGQVGQLLEAWEPLRVEARSEGLVTIIGPESKVNWRPPSGTDVFSWYIRQQGFEPNLSDPGSIATEIVRRLGGLTAMGLVQHPALVALMDKAVRSETGTVKLAEVRKATMEARGNDRARADKLLSRLLERRVLDLGLTLRCPRCSKSNWYSPGELGRTCECSRCLDQFPFPGVQPPKEWAYKPRGGFAAPDFARGSYPVLFSLAALDNLAGRGTWSPSLSLNDDLEIDFAYWAQDGWRPGGERGEWNLLLGEAKTYCEFEEKDIDRARALRAKFPGSTFIFSTLRENLTKDEINRIAAFARPTDREDAAAQPDVIVMTALELYARGNLTSAWKEAGGRASEVAPMHLSAQRSWAASIADITQRLHLGLEGYDAWRWPV